MIRPKYLDGTSIEHKNLESDISEYWDLLHPLVADFINSYAKEYQKLADEAANARTDIDGVRRSLSFEQQNVNDLNDRIRELQKTLQEEAVVRRDLEERLRDERAQVTAKFEEEKRALELVASSKLPEGTSMEDFLSKVQEGAADSAEVKRLQEKVDDLEKKIKSEREENEKIQGELSMSFMEKITKYDEMIHTLKQRLGDDE
ncbi:MAG: hypothetical protein ACXAE3_17810 [Candidatus Kariarchaeaceae archaeon]